MSDDFITKALTRPRCPICDWPMAETMEQGCIPGNCSYRPDDPAEQSRLRQRHAATPPTPSAQTVTAKLVMGEIFCIGPDDEEAIPYDEAVIHLEGDEDSEIRVNCPGALRLAPIIVEAVNSHATLTSSLAAASARIGELETELAKSCDDTRFADSDAGCTRAVLADARGKRLEDALRDIEALMVHHDKYPSFHLAKKINQKIDAALSQTEEGR